MIIYNVNKEKGTVVARFEGGIKYWKESFFSVWRKVGLSPLFTVYDYEEIVDKVMREVSIVGKAKQNPSDTWDEEVGKNIARERLLSKWRKTRDRFIRCVEHELNNYYKCAMERLNRAK